MAPTLAGISSADPRRNIVLIVRFSVLVVTRGRPDALRGTLESVAACDPGPDELVVVDGDDARSAEQTVRQFATAARFPVEYATSSPGLSVQRNRGIELVSGEVVVFLDDDMTLDPGLFAALARAYREPDVIGATGRVIEPEEGRLGGRSSPLRHLLFPGGEQGSMTRFGYPRRMLDPETARDVEWMQGCLMSGRIDAVSAVPHDERITAEYEGEDEDFSYRLSRLGRIRYVPDAVVRHEQLGFRGSRGRSFDRRIVLVRAYLFRKNFERTVVTRLQFAGLIAILLAHRLLNREWGAAAGILEGVVDVWRRRGLLAP
jgi:glycosyltransferase involved in cell wall biosynthesis